MIDLPTFPSPVDVVWAQLDFGGTLGGETGGSTQRLNRLGNRFRVSVKLPPLEDVEAREWVAKLNRGLRTGVRWAIFQPGLVVGAPGTVRVNGAGQAGSAMVIDGVVEDYGLQYAQMFSLVHGGQRYVHMNAGPRTGPGTLQFEPPLRVEPDDNDLIEFAAPKIEGLLADGSADWTVDLAQNFGLQFTISEQG